MSFDSVAVLQRMLESRDSDEMSFPMLTQTGRTVRLSYRPSMSLGAEMDAEDNPFGEMGREMALKMIDMRFRYIFPEGTVVDTASPPVQQSDSTVVYEWGLREMMDASENQDTLFVTATLPSTGPGLWLWITIGVIVLVVGSLLFYLKRLPE